jgi:hypothetical protein
VAADEFGERGPVPGGGEPHQEVAVGRLVAGEVAEEFGR